MNWQATAREFQSGIPEWNESRGVVMTMWDDVKMNLVDWYGAAADKTGEMAKVGVRRYDIFGLSRDIERQFSEIGSIVYSALNEERGDVLEDPQLLALIDKVRDLEGGLTAKEGEITEIKSEFEERKSARAAEDGVAGSVETAEAEPAGEVVEEPVTEEPIEPEDKHAED